MKDLLEEKINLPSRLRKRWEICTAWNAEEASPLKEVGVSPLMAQVLRNRGISEADQARRFLSPVLSDLPSPSTMKDMDKAVARICKALRENEKITIFGDYDVDGVTATSLLLLFLRGAGGRVDFYLPHRMKESYGLNVEAVKKIHARGTNLMITADCGISNVEEVRWAEENGLDVIITDHHEVPDLLPPACAVLNPKQKDCSYPCKWLAGVGVAFNLVIALRSALRQESFWEARGVPNLKEYLDLVALGTISDIVPLLGVNRIFAKYGLEQLNLSARPGIMALKEVAGIRGMSLDSQDINFRFAPRINAAGRLEDAQEAVRLLISEDGTEAKAVAAHLDTLNTFRQRIEEKILAEAREMIKPSPAGLEKKSLVLASANWHPGVIGIVASRLSEEYNRPTVLIALRDNWGKGSGRSIGPFSLFHGFKSCCEWVERYGGHEQAAGLVIRQECILGFSEAFEEVVATRLTEEDLIPRLSIDALAGLDQMNDSVISDIESLAPFGIGNPEPVLGVEDLTVLNSRLVGNGHLRLRIREGRWIKEAIGFRMASWHPLSGKRIRMAFSPRVNLYKGKRTLQLKIVDLQPLD